MKMKTKCPIEALKTAQARKEIDIPAGTKFQKYR